MKTLIIITLSLSTLLGGRGTLPDIHPRSLQSEKQDKRTLPSADKSKEKLHAQHKRWA